MTQKEIEQTIEYCKEWKENLKTEEEIFYNGKALDIAIDCMKTVAKITDVIEELENMAYIESYYDCDYYRKQGIEETLYVIKEKLLGGNEND